jgi:hypothetical protein
VADGLGDDVPFGSQLFQNQSFALPGQHELIIRSSQRNEKQTDFPGITRNYLNSHDIALKHPQFRRKIEISCNLNQLRYALLNHTHRWILSLRN